MCVKLSVSHFDECTFCLAMTDDNLSYNSRIHLRRRSDVHESIQRRVVFPCELKMCNTIDDSNVADEAYSLFAVVVHLGSRPDHGTLPFPL